MTRSRLSAERAAWLSQHILPHEPILRSWLVRKVGHRLEVDDVVQETYAVLAAMADVSHIGNPRAYLFTTAHSVILQNVRRSQIVSMETVAEFDKLDIPHDELLPERHVAAQQQLGRLAAVLARLPRKCREVFLLRKVEGLSQQEIAARLGISENTVEKHIGKGLRLVMASLSEDAGAAEGRPGKGRERNEHVTTTRRH